MFALMVCVAGLLNLPVPVWQPSVVWQPHDTVVAANRAHPWGSYSPGRITLPSDGGQYLLGLAAHEYAHHVLFANGKTWRGKIGEAKAEFVQRNAEVWCHERASIERALYAAQQRAAESHRRVAVRP